jgi:hypothetical protein
MAIEPNNAAIKHSLGLSLVRQRNLGEALPLLRDAAALDPNNARYAYVYAVALNSTGSTARRRHSSSAPTSNIRPTGTFSWA